MTILDTNAVSETLKPAPSEAVVRWLSAQAPAAIFTTAVTQAEIMCGVEALPAGKRRLALSAVVDDIFAKDFHGRVLPFDAESAREYARILAGRKKAGRPMSQFDAMIAAIVRSHGATLATRNTDDFENCGLRLINPWTARDVH